MKKQAVLLSSHVFNDLVFTGYEKLREAIKDYMDLYLLIEVNEDNFIIPESINRFTFSIESFNELNFIPMAETILPGSNHFQLFLFYREHPDYSYYWNIEYDVYCNGDWGILFDGVSTVDSDLLTSHIARYQQAVEWMWWDTLKLQTIDIPKEQYVKSFNPIYRISNKAMAFLDKVLSEGNSGHHEVLIPTVLNHAGYKMNDWGGMGEFVLPGKENTVYATIPNINSYYYSGSSMRYRPLFDLEELESKIKDNLLYHPVKQRAVNIAARTVCDVGAAMNKNECDSLKQAMMNEHDKIVDYLSKRIIDQSSIGLFGKTGLAVYLFMLSRDSNNPGLEEQAWQLLKEVVDSDRKMMSTDFFESVTGICWAIELLNQKQYIEINSDDFFSDVDDMLLQSKLQRSNIHQNDGLFGYGLYFLMRAKSGKALSLTKRQILSFLVTETEKSLYTSSFSNSRIPTLNMYLLNSILFFLIESCQMEVFPALARKSVNGLMRYYKQSLDNCQPCYSDCLTASQLFERVSFMLDDETISACHAMQKRLCEQMKNCNIRQKDMDSLTWNGLMYSLNIKNDRIVSHINEMPVTMETETSALLCHGLLLLQINESNHERN